MSHTKIEEKKRQFNLMWNQSKFNWGELEGKEINPERIWNVFIEPTLTDISEEARKEERERVAFEADLMIRRGLNSGAIPQTDDYSNGWNESRQQSYKNFVSVMNDFIKWLTPQSLESDNESI